MVYTWLEINLLMSRPRVPKTTTAKTASGRLHALMAKKPREGKDDGGEDESSILARAAEIIAQIGLEIREVVGKAAEIDEIKKNKKGLSKKVLNDAVRNARIAFSSDLFMLAFPYSDLLDVAKSIPPSEKGKAALKDVKKAIAGAEAVLSQYTPLMLTRPKKKS